MVDGRKIRARCKELGKAVEELAKALNIAVSTLYKKLDNTRPMDLKEANIIQKELMIPDSQFKDYFNCEEKDLMKGELENGIENYNPSGR